MSNDLALSVVPGMSAVQIMARPESCDTQALSSIMNSLPNSFLSISICSRKVRMSIGCTMYASSASNISRLSAAKANLMSKTLSRHHIGFQHLTAEQENQYFTANFDSKAKIQAGCLVGIPQAIADSSQMAAFVQAAMECASNVELLILYRRVAEEILSLHQSIVSNDYGYLEMFSKSLPALKTQLERSKEEMTRIETARRLGYGTLQAILITAGNESGKDLQVLGKMCETMFSDRGTLKFQPAEFHDIYSSIISREIKTLNLTTYINAEELSAFAQLPLQIEKSLELPSFNVPIFNPSDGTVCLGSVLHRDLPVGRFNFPMQALQQHASIIGSTGQGKTGFLLDASAKILSKKTTTPKLIVISPTSEFNQLAKLFPHRKILVFKVGNLLTPLRLNLFKSQTKDSPVIWVRKIWDSLKNPLQIQEPTYTLILQLCTAVIRNANKDNRIPSMIDLKVASHLYEKMLETVKLGYYRKEKIAQADFRFDFIMPKNMDGTWDPIFHTPTSLDFKEIVKEYDIILDCSGLTSNSFIIINSIVSTMLRLVMEEEAKNSEYGLKVVVIHDEVSQLEYETLTRESDIALSYRLDRKYGIGNISANQGTAGLSEALLTNSNTKIVFNSVDSEGNLCKLMGLDDSHKALFQRLPPNVAIVKMMDKEPFLIKTERVERFSVSDDEIIEHMKPFYEKHPEQKSDSDEFLIFRGRMENFLNRDPDIDKYLYEGSKYDKQAEDKPEDIKKLEASIYEKVRMRFEGKVKAFEKEKRIHEAFKKELEQAKKLRVEETVLNPKELEYLKDIAADPFLSVTERNAKLKLTNTGEANEIKKSLKDKGFIDNYSVRPLSIARTPITISGILPEAREEIKKYGIELKGNQSYGKADHQFYIEDLAKTYRENKFITFTEYEIPGSPTKERVDMVAQKLNSDGKVIFTRAHEIETGLENPEQTVKNARKCLDAGFDEVWIVAIDPKDEYDIYGLLEKAGIAPNPKLSVKHIRKIFSKKRRESP
ncbi:MAG: hypothetical protein ABII22_04645 [Candidatus Micrarchaeota archaeon]